MGFIKKIWKDRISEFPTRRSLTKTDGTSELVTVARSEGMISEEGDAFSAENMNDLENRVEEGFSELNENLADKDNPILLLDTTSVTTSFKDFDLAQSYKNFKKLYFEVEMDLGGDPYIYYFYSEIYVATLQPNRRYFIYRQVARKSQDNGIAACLFKIIENDPTKLSIMKGAEVYNGCRRINVFGIK